ncbi:MAG: hypothetical protein WDO16_26170 [Bacteroidota bacterium]
MKKTLLLILFAAFCILKSNAQAAEELIAQVKAKLDKVNDYEASGKMKTNVAFIKVPVATVKVYFKKPGKLRIKNEKGISFIPKGSVNVNLGNVFAGNANYEIIDAGSESGTGYRIIKLLPQDENADVVLSTLYIDEKLALVKKAKTTTKENGTYELELSYGKYAEYGLADKVIFSFNTKDYKLPKGVTFDYDDGTKKDESKDKTKNKKGKVEITYSSYIINKGVADNVFQ